MAREREGRRCGIGGGKRESDLKMTKSKAIKWLASSGIKYMDRMDNQQRGEQRNHDGTRDQAQVAQTSTMQYSAMQYSTVQYSTVHSVPDGLL